MLMNLLLGLPTMVLCLFLQALLIVAVSRYYESQYTLINNPSIWALLFMFLGEFQQFSEAFYHSAVNFATLGYGDFVMSDEHKLLGPLEAVNGVLMIGVSTSILMTGLQDAMRKTRQARKQ